MLGFGFLVFGGCVGSSGGTSAADVAGSGPVQPTADPNSDMGVVTGTITSDEAVALAGAAVGLRDTNFTAVSDDKGLFGMRDVPPGKYSMDIAKLGYESAARTIEVKQGQATNVVIQLRALAVTDEVYPEVTPFAGYYDCAVAVPTWISACSWPYTAVVGGFEKGWCDPFVTGACTPAPGVNLTQYGVPADIQANKFHFNMTIRNNIGAYVGEAQWSPSSAAATRLNFMVSCGDYDPLADDCKAAIRYGPQNGVAGTSPIKDLIQSDNTYWFKGQAKAKGTKFDLATHDKIWIMTYVGLPFPKSSDPTTIQAAFQQRFSVWVTIFYNGPAPDDYTIIKN